MRPHLPLTYHHYLRRLEAVYESGEARALLRMACAAVGLSWTDVLCADFTRLRAVDTEHLDAIIARLEQHEPIQYILGEALFCDHRFLVDRRVLIPRPETEDLVQVIDEVLGSPTDENDDIKTVLDIGTGSGCIGVTLALQHPRWHIVAWDNSADALVVAALNAERHRVSNILFEERDILTHRAEGEQWDLIVSNPPYVCSAERQTMAANVLDYEPQAALFVPDRQPLLFYEAIAAYAATTLTAAGHLFVEVNPLFAADVCALFANEGLMSSSIKQDRFDRDRIVHAARK